MSEVEKLKAEIARLESALDQKRRDCDVLMVRWRNEQAMRLAAERQAVGNPGGTAPIYFIRATGGTDGEMTA